MLPQDEFGHFKRIVDIALIRYMQGFLDRQPKESGHF